MYFCLTSVAEQNFVTGYEDHSQNFKQLGDFANLPMIYFRPTALGYFSFLLFVFLRITSSVTPESDGLSGPFPYFSTNGWIKDVAGI